MQAPMHRLLGMLLCCLSACAAAAPPGAGPDGGCMTLITGVTTAPNGVDPLQGVSVYIPRATPAPFPAAVGCEGCAGPGEDAQGAVAHTVSGLDGTFTLLVPTLVPEGLGNPDMMTQVTAGSTTTVDVYLQRGRWRRRLQVPVRACQQTQLAAGQAHLPRSQAEGDLPRMAVAVGDFDAIECVLADIGISPGEFTAPGGGGAVHLYELEGRTPGTAPGGVSLSQLLLDPVALQGYQIVLLNCTDAAQIQPVVQDPLQQLDLRNYVAAGGRLYASDWAYNFLAQQPAWAPFLCFEGGPCGPGAAPGFQQAALGDPTGFYGQALSTGLLDWLGLRQIGLGTGQVPIGSLLQGWALLHSAAADQASYPSTTWLHGVASGADRPLTVTFDYPQPSACGRVLYSSYHTRGHSGAAGLFPAYCPVDGIIPQERVLEYLLFQATDCVPIIG